MTRIEANTPPRQIGPPGGLAPLGAAYRLCLSLTALAIGFGGFFSPAAAQSAICGQQDEIKKILSERYKESQRAFGLVSDSGLVEVFTSQGGTWSILMASPTGRTCVIAAGHTWQELEQALTGPAA